MLTAEKTPLPTHDHIALTVASSSPNAEAVMNHCDTAIQPGRTLSLHVFDMVINC